MSAGREPSCPSTGILACPLTGPLSAASRSPYHLVPAARSAFLRGGMRMPSDFESITKFSAAANTASCPANQNSSHSLNSAPVSNRAPATTS
jgi:hypothetical protein